MMKTTTIGKFSKNAEAFLEGLQNKRLAVLNDTDRELLIVDCTEPMLGSTLLYIRQSLEKEKCLLFLENIKQEQFPENSLFTTDSEVCILKSDSHGRRQQLLIYGAKEQPKTNTVNFTTETNNLEAGLKNTIKFDLEHALNWLHQLEFEKEQHTPLTNSEISGAITIQTQDYSNEPNGNNSQYPSFKVKISTAMAPIKKKIIQLNSTGSKSNKTVKKSQSLDKELVSETYKDNIILYPGTKATFDKNEVQLPEDWRIINTNKKNNKVTYEAPEDDNSNQMFRTFIGCKKLQKNTGDGEKTTKYNSVQQLVKQHWDYFSVNLAAVTFPII